MNSTSFAPIPSRMLCFPKAGGLRCTNRILPVRFRYNQHLPETKKECLFCLHSAVMLYHHVHEPSHGKLGPLRTRDDSHRPCGFHTRPRMHALGQLPGGAWNCHVMGPCVGSLRYQRTESAWRHWHLPSVHLPYEIDCMRACAVELCGSLIGSISDRPACLGLGGRWSS